MQVLTRLAHRLRRSICRWRRVALSAHEPEQPSAREARSEEFASAWALFDQASRVAHELPAMWNELVGTDLFSTSVYVDNDGLGRVDAFIDDYDAPRLEDLQNAARRFVVLLLASAREALLDAERCVSAAFRAPGGEHLPRFPLCEDISEFKAFVDSGALAGLRPDQIQLIEQFQAYYSPGGNGDSHTVFRHFVQHLHHLSQIIDQEQTPIVAFWAHSAQPQFRTETPGAVTEVQAQPDGVLVETHCVATFHVPPGTRVQANPGMALDPIFNAEPWPRDPDDGIGVRSRGLLLIVEELIQGLERSVGLRPPLHQGHFRLLPLPEDDPLWARVNTSASPDIEIGLNTSDLGLASYRAGDEFIMLVQRPDGVYGRIVPQPAPLDQSIERGEAAEDASRGSAARWGLPDFVLKPRIVQRGTATRQVGDGTIVCGDRGLAVQVKARTAATDRPDRERAWITKKIAEGARQASGSVRTVQQSPLAHINARGRSITVDGSSVDWIGVVVVDHDNPPDRLSFVADAAPLPHVALLRREWDFLFDQLRSTTAVVDYLHRIAPDQIAVGEHVANYYELALADEQTPPDISNSRIPESLGDPTLRSSHPVLPLQPASTADEYGARMYRQMLEDIADGPWNRDENDRLHLLVLLDRLPIAERSVIGRRLLTHLGQAPRVSTGTSRWDMRRYLLGNAYLHLGYVVCNEFTALHEEAFRGWTMLRHHEWTSALNPKRRPEAATVAVMLTPRHDAVRPWDTTVFAIFGDLELEADEIEALQRLWNRPQAGTDSDSSGSQTA
jgi:hypothetical protein